VIREMNSNADSVLARLYEGIKRVDANRFPRTAKLVSGDPRRIAQKLGEEAIEVAIEMIKGDRSGVISESADLLYHLVVLWAAMNVGPGEIWQEMERREANFGLAEKLPKETSDRGEADETTVVPFSSGIARWRQIAETLRQEVTSGVFVTGRLPTESSLATRFHVNRHTVRRAVAVLVKEGIVRVEQGRGTFVHA
jgi:phosphoribosyl-ATP pyrophosphohydrolase